MIHNNLSDVTFDTTGIAKIQTKMEKKPGEYYLLNNTVYTCLNKSDTS